MEITENVKKIVENATGLWRPSRRAARMLPRKRRPRVFHFADDGETPNNPVLPLILYEDAVEFGGYDPAAVFEALFNANGWGNAWRDTIYPYHHFHSRTHEVLGIARGGALLRFGGAFDGEDVPVEAGDVVLIPAGVGHRFLDGSNDFLVVGAYPETGSYDEPRASPRTRDDAVESIPGVPLPARDPVYGTLGPGLALWRRAMRRMRMRPPPEYRREYASI